MDQEAIALESLRDVFGTVEPVGKPPVWLSQVRRGAAQFEVRTKSTSATGGAINTLNSKHAGIPRALGALALILQQWARSNNPPLPGTTVSIVDRRDGGTVVKLQYLGFESDLFTGR